MNHSILGRMGIFSSCVAVACCILLSVGYTDADEYIIFPIGLLFLMLPRGVLSGFVRSSDRKISAVHGPYAPVLAFWCIAFTLLASYDIFLKGLLAPFIAKNDFLKSSLLPHEYLLRLH